ncbi:restriction endonuclease subunit S [Variovorax sp. J22R133]|uniref:restriction endonuclease subunit S n=1 Tax=Variovorax brevis TaxID=3053503 RepID=UPI002576E789|nr:restriction endonuclease subunit S [Variovorax sp. J22R133]MDM0113948.1 restriction endonuclease subunit S [Variovorax sp. J22R133]
MSSEVKLANVTSLIADCPHSTPKWMDSGVVVLRNQYIKDGRLYLDAPSFTDEAHFKQRVRRAIPTYKDIVLTREAPIGQLCQIPKGLKCCLGQRLVLIRPDPEKVDPDFLFYSLRSPVLQKQMLVVEGEGTTVSNLRIPYIENLRLPLPARPAQERAAALLRAIDDQLEVLENQNAALESVGRAVFESWFVNFDPLLTQSEDTPVPVPSAYPCALGETELGPVPHGWDVCAFSETVNIHSGGTPKTAVPAYWGGPVPWFSVADAPAPGQVFVLRTEKTITEAGLANSAAKLLPQRSTIISARGTVGKTGMVEGKMTINQSCYALSTKRKAGEYWVYFQTLALITKLRQIAHGGVFDTITRATFEGVKVVWPDEATLSEYNERSKPLFDAIVVNGRTHAALMELRDTLLPRLISGQLAPAIAEAAVAELLAA